IVNRDADRALSSCHVICLRRYALIRPSAPSAPGRGAGGKGTFEPTGCASTNYPAESGFVNNSICSTSFSMRLRTSSRSRRSAWSSFSSAAEPLEPSLESAFDRSSSRSTARFSAWACLKTSTALRSFFSSCSNLTWVTLTRNQFFSLSVRSLSVCRGQGLIPLTSHSSLVTCHCLTQPDVQRLEALDQPLAQLLDFLARQRVSQARKRDTQQQAVVSWRDRAAAEQVHRQEALDCGIERTANGLLHFTIPNTVGQNQ